MKKILNIFCAIALMFCFALPALALTNAGVAQRKPKPLFWWEFRTFSVYSSENQDSSGATDSEQSEDFRNQPFAKLSSKQEFVLSWSHAQREQTGGGTDEYRPNPKNIVYKIRYGCGLTSPQVYRQTSQPIIVPFAPLTDLATVDEIKTKFVLNPGPKDCFCKIWVEMRELDQFGQLADKPALGAANSRPIQVCDNPPVGSYPPAIETLPAKYDAVKKGFDFPFYIRDMGNVPKVLAWRYIISPEAGRQLQFFNNFGSYEKDLNHVSIYPPGQGMIWSLFHTGYYLSSAGVRPTTEFCYFFEIDNTISRTRGATFCGFPNTAIPGKTIQLKMMPPDISIDKINKAPAKKVSIKAYVNGLGGGKKVLAVHQVLKTKNSCDDLNEEEWLNSKNKPKEFIQAGSYDINWDFGKSDIGAHYCYRFFAANEGNTAIAGPFSFVVKDSEENDLLLVLPPNNAQIADTWAELSADVFKPEQIKSVYFSVWRTDKKGEFVSPDIAKNISKNFVSYKISDLVPGANYEYNAKGTDINRHEFWTATSEKFTTKPGKPVIILDKSDVGVKTNDASFSGHIEEFGGNPKVKVRVFLYPAETSPSGLWECDSRDGQVGNSGNVFDLGWRVPNGKTATDGAKFSYSLSGLSMSGVDRPYCFYFGATGSIANKSSYTEPVLTQKYVVAPKCTKPDIVRKPESFEISTRPNYTGNLNSDPMKVYFKWVAYDDAGKPIKNGFKGTADPDQEFKIGQTATTSLTLADIGANNAGKKVCVYALAKNLITDSASAISKENETCLIFPKLPEIENLRAIMTPNGEGTFYGKAKSFGTGYSGQAFFKIRPLNLNEVTSTWPINSFFAVGDISKEYAQKFNQRDYMLSTILCRNLLATGERSRYDKICSAQTITEGLDLAIQFCIKSDCLVKGNFVCESCSAARTYRSNTDIPKYSQLSSDRERENQFGERMGYFTCGRPLSGSWPCVGTSGQSGGCGDLTLDMAVMYFYKNNKTVAKLFDQQYKAILNDKNNMTVIVNYKNGARSYQLPRNKIFTYNYKIGDSNIFNSTCSDYSEIKCDDSDNPKATNFPPTPFRFFRWLHYNGSWRYEVGDWQLESDKALNRISIYDTFKKIGLLMTNQENISIDQVKSATDKGYLVAFRCNLGTIETKDKNGEIVTYPGTHYMLAYKVENGYVYIKDPAQTFGARNHDNIMPIGTFVGSCGGGMGAGQTQWIIQPLPEKSP